MLLFFILGYLGLSGFLLLGLLWASNKGDSVQIRTTPEDLVMPHEPRLARRAAVESRLDLDALGGTAAAQTADIARLNALLDKSE